MGARCVVVVVVVVTCDATCVNPILTIDPSQHALKHLFLSRSARSTLSHSTMFLCAHLRCFIDLDEVRRSTGTEKDTREVMTAGVKYLLRSLERAMSMEEATKKGQVQEFFYNKLQRRPGQPMAEWVNVFEKAVLDMKAEGLKVELKSMGWHLFEKSNLTVERQERMWEGADGEHVFAAIRGAPTKLFLDTILSQEKRSVPDRKPSHVLDRKTSDRFKNRFREPRDGKTGRYIAHETDAHDAEEDPNSEEEESCEEESDLTAAFERENGRVGIGGGKNWKTLWMTRTWKTCGNFQSPGTRDSPPPETHAKLRENEESRLSAFLASLSRSFRFATFLP